MQLFVASGGFRKRICVHIIIWMSETRKWAVKGFRIFTFRWYHFLEVLMENAGVGTTQPQTKYQPHILEKRCFSSLIFQCILGKNRSESELKRFIWFNYYNSFSILLCFWHTSIELFPAFSLRIDDIIHVELIEENKTIITWTKWSWADVKDATYSCF